MLETISWPAYLASISVVTLAYYSWVAFSFFQPELAAAFQNRRIQDDGLEQSAAYPNEDVFGQGLPDDEQIVGHEDIEFGDPEDDDPVIDTPVHTTSDQVSDFSEMVSEVKTLIRVIADSAESRENFDLLFGLVIQKYHGLSESPYREKINAFLLSESTGKLSFEVSKEELDQLWDKHLNH